MANNKYTVIFDDENNSFALGDFETEEEAKNYLAGTIYDSEIDMACMDNLNTKFDWDDDKLGFMVTMWNGDDIDAATEYTERCFRVHEIDEAGNIIDED